MELRRVVVTGLGMVTPLANGVEQTWSRLLTGASGVRRVTRFDVSDLAAQIAAEVPRGNGPGDFDAAKYVSQKDSRKMARYCCGLGV